MDVYALMGRAFRNLEALQGVPFAIIIVVGDGSNACYVVEAENVRGFKCSVCAIANETLLILNDILLAVAPYTKLYRRVLVIGRRTHDGEEVITVVDAYRTTALAIDEGSYLGILYALAILLDNGDEGHVVWEWTVIHRYEV